MTTQIFTHRDGMFVCLFGEKAAHTATVDSFKYILTLQHITSPI